jgi:hypothetical protein
VMADLNQDKALRLIDYIKSLASIRTKQLTNIESYDNVLWFKDIPQEKGCFTRMWQTDSEYDPDIWIEVINKKEPKLPPLPGICKKWVNPAQLNDKTNIPEISL